MLPIVTLGMYFNTSVKHDMYEHAVERNQVLANSIAELIGAHMQQPLLSLRQILLEKKTRLEEWHHQGLLNAVVQQTGFFQSIFLVDRDGQVLDVGVPERLKALRPELLELDFRGHDLFNNQTPRSRPVWSGVSSSIITGNPVISVVLDYDDGMIIGGFSLERLEPIFSGFVGQAQQEVLLLDRQGVVIQSSDPRKGAEALSVSNIPVVQLGMNGEAGTRRYMVGDTDVVGTVSLVPDIGWMVVMQQGYDEVVGMHGHVITTFWLISSLFIIPALGIGIWCSRKMVDILDQLGVLFQAPLEEGTIPAMPKFLTTEFREFWSAGCEAVSKREKRIRMLAEYNADILEAIETLGMETQKLNQQDRALRLKAESMDNLLASIASGIISINEAFEITFCNQRALDILGYANEHHLKGRKIASIMIAMPGQQNKCTRGPGCPFPCDGCEEGHCTATLMDAKGLPIMIDFTANPLTKEDERVGCVILFHPIANELAGVSGLKGA